MPFAYVRRTAMGAGQASPERSQAAVIRERHQNLSSGFMAKANTAPTTISPMEPTKGQSQLPVTSMIQPPTTGLKIAAIAEPIFMNPLAVPEYFGAMSIGIAHMGPIVSSAKKKPKLKQIAAMVESWMNNIGSSEASAPKLQTTTM